MKWQPLYLDQTSSLQKEVDSTVKLFRQLRNSGKITELNNLAQELHIRCREIEDFTSRNHHDDRVVLVEKQYLRLSKLLQGQGTPPTSSQRRGAPFSDPNIPGAEEHDLSPTQWPVRSPASSQSSSMRSTQSPPSASGLAISSPPGRPSSPRSATTRNIAFSSPSSPTPEVAPRIKPPRRDPPKPPPRPSPVPPGTSLKETQKMVPAGQKGHYRLFLPRATIDTGNEDPNNSGEEGGESIPTPYRQGAFDFQIILTEAEHQQLMLLRRAKAAEAHHARRARAHHVAATEAGAVECPEERAFVTSRGPFIDNAILESATSRTKQKSKWVNPNRGFRF